MAPSNPIETETYVRVLPIHEKITPVRNLKDAWQRSLDHPEEFWAQQAKQLDWFKEWDRVLKWENHHAKWFDGGLINVCYNCVDRHAKTSNKNKVAIIWEGENGDSRGITYHSLYREVNKLASALKELGVTKETT